MSPCKSKNGFSPAPTFWAQLIYLPHGAMMRHQGLMND